MLSRVFVGLVGLVGLAGLVILAVEGKWTFVGLIIGLLTLGTFVSVRRIPWPEEWIIDRFGKLIKKRPGFRIIIPGIDRIVKKIKVRVQYSIPLFPGEEQKEERKEIKIELKKGGQIILKDPRVWIVVNDSLKAVQTAVDFEEQIREIVEHRLTGILNSLTFEEVMEMKKPKKLGEGRKEEWKGKLDELIAESEDLKNFLKECECEYKGFTIDDFDFDEETSRKRNQRISTEIEIEIAQNKAQAKKNEMGAIKEFAKKLIEEGLSSEKAFQIASERYQDHLAAEKGELKKIVWSGGNPIPKIASQWEMGKGILLPKPKEKETKENPFKNMTEAEIREYLWKKAYEWEEKKKKQK